MRAWKLKIKNLKNTIQSPTNNSKSKESYSFSKSPRFPKRIPTCPSVSYNDSSIKISKKGANIGSGKKFDFTKNIPYSPGVGKYNLEKSSEIKFAKKYYSIGLSRQKIAYRSYINKQICMNPSANSYRIQSQNKSPRYSFRSRTKVLNKSLTIEPQNQNPAPGDYSLTEDVHSVRYFKKIPTPSFNLNRLPRFPKIKCLTPGPGSHNEIRNISSVGKYIVSSHKGGIVATFNKSNKMTIFQEQIKKKQKQVGPGAYETPSQFGNCRNQSFDGLNRLTVPLNDPCRS